MIWKEIRSFKETLEERKGPQEEVAPSIEGALHQGLEDKFNKTLEQERKPEEPKISIKIFYSPHGSAKDLKGLKEEFAKCDIFIPEGYAWTKGDLEILRGLSFGKIRPFIIVTDKNRIAKERMKFPEEMIYNSQKPIALIDVPENHPIVKEIKNYESEMKGKKIFHYGNFAQTMESFKKALAEEAFLEKEREEYMLSQLKPQVDALLNEYPNLRDKQGISILLSLGVSHTSLYHSLKKENFEVTRIFNKMPFVYPYRNEVVRRYLFGKSVDDLLLSRALTEVLFWEAFGAQLDENEGHDSQKIAEFTRRLISAFSFDEIKNMFEGASKFDEWPSFLYMNLKKGFETS